MLGILQYFIIIDRLIDEAKRCHQFFELLSLAFLSTVRFACDDIHEILTQLISLTASLLPHSVQLPHTFLIFFLIVLDGPAILLGVIIPVPADSRSDQFCVESWTWSIGNETWFLWPFHAQLNVKLLALWVFRTHWLDDPRSVFRIAELVSAVSPHDPLITSWFDLHILRHKLLDTLSNSEAIQSQQKLQLTTIRLLLI